MIRNSIRNKLILFLLAATILPISTSIVMTYFVTERQVIEDTIQTNSRLIYQGKTNMVNYLESIKQASTFVYNDPSFYSVIENGAPGYGSRNEVIRGLISVHNAVRDIHQVYLYLSTTDKAYLYTRGNVNLNETGQSKYVPAIQHSNIRIEPTHVSHTYELFSINPLPVADVFTLHRSISNALTLKDLGTLSIDVRLDYIREICSQLYATGEELYVLDESGSIIFSSKPQLIGAAIAAPWVTQVLATADWTSSGSGEWSDDAFKGIQIYEHIRMPYANWTIVKRIPSELLYAHAAELTYANTVILIVFMIVVILGTLYVSFRFTAPIKKLIGYIGIVQTGNMQVDIHVTSKDEFGILAQRFRTMMQRIDELIHKEYKLELANKTNQLKALQAQINPHFLYNALQSIGTLALQQETTKVYTLLSSLAKIMRYSMNNDETSVMLKREVEHVRAYLDLQLQRFEDELTVTIDVSEEAESVRVPKMLLQPLVENYFKHGFEPRTQAGRLYIGGFINAEGCLQLTVRDNGKGLNADQLESLQQSLRLPLEPTAGGGGGTAASDSIGLRNVLARLMLYDGSGRSKDARTRMHIEVPPEGGFQVTITIPLQLQLEEEE
ncbi:sensor histidine kinase [Paenibacillus sp. YYML68]|uniref:cache domain-containing sensor histidine kinase n=1 Tax=Paenibacillus sp. YYML68 TaxID=2909250 RepID=UPI00248FCF0A|nr:sensor histidine kinase [Paenibacillus sp. YYML68]